MKNFSFKNNSLKHDFTFININGNLYLDIVTYICNGSYYTGLRLITNRKIIWEDEGFLKLSIEAKTYIEKITKLLVFT